MAASPPAAVACWRCSYRVPARWLDELSAALWDGDLLGLEVGDEDSRGLAMVHAYSRARPRGLDEHWRRRGVEALGCETMAARDWLGDYRAGAAPQRVSARFIVDPRAIEVAEPPSEGQLSIPAEQAFGTGSHESTSLALELLERDDLAGATVLDVGCGSGILALAATRLGASRVVAFDCDPIAGYASRRNARRNHCAVQVFVGHTRSLLAAARFDRVVANLLFSELQPELAPLASLIADGGRLVVSGSLCEDEERLHRAAAALGLVPRDEVRRGEWLGCSFRRP